MPDQDSPQQHKPEPRKPDQPSQPVRTCKSTYHHPRPEPDENTVNANTMWLRPAKEFKTDLKVLHTTEDPDHSTPTHPPTNPPTANPPTEVLSTNKNIPQSLAKAKRSPE